MTHAGLFISLEGVDGCGKSTQTQLLSDWLRQRGSYEVVTTREPGGTPLGVKLRQLIQHGDDMGPRAEALLYAADRAHHVDTLIRPALKRGAIVLSDRYLDSSVAYQAAGRHMPPDQIDLLSRWATNGLMPQVTVLVDVDPAVALARQVGEPDRIEREGVGFQEAVRQGYLDRIKADSGRWVVVPGEGTPAQVFEAIKAALLPVITRWEEQTGALVAVSGLET